MRTRAMKEGAVTKNHSFSPIKWRSQVAPSQKPGLANHELRRQSFFPSLGLNSTKPGLDPPCFSLEKQLRIALGSIQIASYEEILAIGR